MNALGYNPNNTSTDPSTAAGVGNAAAAAVLAFRANDGANQANGWAAWAKAQTYFNGAAG